MNYRESKEFDDAIYSIENWKSKIEELEKDVEDKDIEIEQLRDTIGDLERELSDLKSNIQA